MRLSFLIFLLIIDLAISLSSIASLPAIVHAAIADHTPPIIRHTPPVTLTQGEELVITAIVEDDSEISWVNLWYRIKGEEFYKKVKMEQINHRTYKVVIKAPNEKAMSGARIIDDENKTPLPGPSPAGGEGAKLIPPPLTGGGQGEGGLWRFSYEEIIIMVNGNN